MTKRADPETLQRRHWRKALAIARILFEEDGYHTAYLDEIQSFIAAQSAVTQPMQVEPAAAPPPAAPAESRYRTERYPHSRFWAVRDGEDLVAVTAFRLAAPVQLRQRRMSRNMPATGQPSIPLMRRANCTCSRNGAWVPVP